MSKGFLTIAQNGKEDYIRMAYALAMSLKLSQRKYNDLSIVVNEGQEIPEHYKKVFDQILYIPIPKEDWKIQNKWSYLQVSPYDETICLDSDMLFFHDITTWWNCLENTDIDFTSKVVNYRGDIVTTDYYRKVFTNNNLPNLYTALFYFKKTQEVKDFFLFVKIIFENWQVFYNKLLKNPPKFLSGDVVYSIAAKLMFNKKWNNEYLTFVHMRSKLQDKNIFTDWNKELQTFFTNYNDQIFLKVSNFNQIYPFHYINKQFLNNEVIELYEENTLHLFQ